MLMEILRRGVVDSVSQSVAILYMALGPEDVSKLRVGKLTEYTYAPLLGFVVRPWAYSFFIIVWSF